MKILMASASLILAIVLTMNVMASGFFDHLNQVVEAASGIRLFAETSGDIRANKMLSKFRESKNIYRPNQSALEVAIRHSSKNFDELANEKFLSSCREWREIAFYCANRKNSKINDERLKEWAIDSIQSGDHSFLCNMNIGEYDIESSRLFKLGISLYAGAECNEREKSDILHWLSYFNKLGTPTSDDFLMLLLKEAPSKFGEAKSSIYDVVMFRSCFANELDASFLVRHPKETTDCFSSEGMLQNYLTWYDKLNSRSHMRPLQLKVILTEEIQSEHQAEFLKIFSQHEKS